jgi:hypothetical protein
MFEHPIFDHFFPGSQPQGEGQAPPPDPRRLPRKERSMPFIRLEDHDSNGSFEYFIRPDLIREVDVGRNDLGKIVSVDVYLMDGNYEVREDSAFTFKDEAAEAAYNTLRPFLTTS